MAAADTLTFSVCAFSAVQIVKCERHDQFPIGEPMLCARPRLPLVFPWFAIPNSAARRRHFFDFDEVANLRHHAAD